MQLLGQKEDRMRGWKRHGRSKKDTRLTRLSLPYNLTNGLCSLSLKMAQRVVDSDSKIQAELCRCSGSNGKKRGLAIPNFGQQPCCRTIPHLFSSPIMHRGSRTIWTSQTLCLPGKPKEGNTVALLVWVF